MTRRIVLALWFCLGLANRTTADEMIQVSDEGTSGGGEGKGEAPKVPLDGDEGDGEDREHHERERVLHAGHAGVEEAEEARGPAADNGQVVNLIVRHGVSLIVEPLPVLCVTFASRPRFSFRRPPIRRMPRLVHAAPPAG